MISAHAVVNAAGVWSDDVRALDEGRDPDSIRPAKGVHITVPHELAVRNASPRSIPVPKDRRSVFVVPHGDLTYVGTTDTDYDGPLDDPQCTPDDIDYLLRAINGAVRQRDHPRRHRRHLGRPASAGEGGVERPHRRPVAPPLACAAPTPAW